MEVLIYNKKLPTTLVLSNFPSSKNCSRSTDKRIYAWARSTDLRLVLMNILTLLSNCKEHKDFKNNEVYLEVYSWFYMLGYFVIWGFSSAGFML